MRPAEQPDPAPPNLSARRQDIPRFFTGYTHSNGYGPTLREIGDTAGLASTSSVKHQTEAPGQKGCLSRGARRPRTAAPRMPVPPAAGRDRDEPGEQGLSPVPLVGRISAARGLDAIELAEEVIPLPAMLAGQGDHIMLRVVGDSMTGAAVLRR